MSCYILQEDGFRIELEEGTGFLIQDGCVPTTTQDSVMGGTTVRGRRRPFEDLVAEDDEDALNAILITV